MITETNYKKMKEICNKLSVDGWSNDYTRDGDWCAKFTNTFNGIKYGYYIRINEHKNNIEVSSTTIRSPIDSYYWNVECDSINIGFQKSVDTIIKDIQRRFLNKFQIKADKYLDTAVNHVTYITKRRDVMQQACKVLGFKDYDLNSERETQTGYFKNNSVHPYFKLMSYGDGLKIEIDTVSIEQLRKIVEVFK